jgi:hypothetical protein
MTERSSSLAFSTPGSERLAANPRTAYLFGTGPAVRPRLRWCCGPAISSWRTAVAPFGKPAAYPEWPGALLLRLARNRNIRRNNGSVLARVGGGPYKADSSVAMLGAGKVAITPEYVTGFAHLLGYEPRDMVALTGVGPAIVDWPAHSASAELAVLAWNARRLTAGQLSEVISAARKTR